MERSRDEETERPSDEETQGSRGVTGATTCSAAKGRALVRVTIISVLLGLITTIAVAWSIAIAVPMPATSAGPPAPPPTGGGARTPRALANYIDSLPRIGILDRDGRKTIFMLERSPGTWALTVLGSAGGRMADAIPFDQLPNRAEIDDVPSWSRLRTAPDEEPAHEFRVYTETARGWPMPALRETHILDPMAQPPERLIGGIPIQRTAPTGMDPRSLPLIPIWRGLILNCLIFGSAWYVILFGVPGLLRWRRRKIRQLAGQCPSCGYDLEGRLDAGCPECGWGRPS
jgi:hypothetical protein